MKKQVYSSLLALCGMILPFFLFLLQPNTQKPPSSGEEDICSSMFI